LSGGQMSALQVSRSFLVFASRRASSHASSCTSAEHATSRSEGDALEPERNGSDAANDVWNGWSRRRSSWTRRTRRSRRRNGRYGRDDEVDDGWRRRSWRTVAMH
jgi:hypothetical protein